MRQRRLAGAIVALALGGSVACANGSAATREALRSVPETVPTTVEATTTSATSTSTTTTTSPPSTTAPPVATRFSIEPYRGLGVWVDVFDWSVAYTANPIGVADIDLMAEQGAQTLFIQTNRYDHPAGELEPDRLQTLIERAHARGLHVVAWYLPTLTDPAEDLRRLLSAAALDVDGLAVDIESLAVEDPAERTRRLVDLSTALRRAMGDEPVGAIVLEPVVMEDVNPDYWRGYPWTEMAPLYDVWLPMAYWTNRTGPWRSAHDYIATNVDRVRERLGQPDAAVHAVGGVGDKTTVEDLEAMAVAVDATGPIGASIYDYRTTKPEHWEVLRRFRS